MYANCMKLFLLFQVLASVHGDLDSIINLENKNEDNFFKTNDVVNHLEIFSFAPSFCRQSSWDGIHLTKKAFIPPSNWLTQNASNEYECELDFSTIRSRRSDVRSQRSGIRSHLSDISSQQIDVRSSRSDVRSSRSDVRSSRSDVRSSRSDVRSSRSDVRSSLSDVRSSRSDVRSSRNDVRSQRKYNEERRSMIVKPTRRVFGQDRRSRLPPISRNSNELRIVINRNLDSSRREMEFRRVSTRRMDSDKLRIRQTRTENNNGYREMMRKEGRVGVIRDNINMNRIRVFNTVENTRRQRNDPSRRENRATSRTDVSRRIRIGEFKILGNERKSDSRIQSFYRENNEIRNRIVEQKLLVANEFNTRHVRNMDATRLERQDERRIISKYTDKVRDHDTYLRKNSRTEISVFRASLSLRHLENVNMGRRVESRDISRDITRGQYENYSLLGKSGSRQSINSEIRQRTLREAGNRISISERRQYCLREARTRILTSERRQDSLRDARNQIFISERRQHFLREAGNGIPKSERRQDSLREAKNQISTSESRQHSLREIRNQISISERRQHSMQEAGNRISISEAKQHSLQEAASRISKSEGRQQSLREAKNRISTSERRQFSLQEAQNRVSKSDRIQHSLWDFMNRISKTERLFGQNPRSRNERIQRRQDFRRQETLLKSRFDLKQDIWFEEANFSGGKTGTRVQRGRATDRFETKTVSRRMAHFADNGKTDKFWWEKSLPRTLDVVIITLLFVCELHAVAKETTSKKMGNISSVFNFLLGTTSA